MPPRSICAAWPSGPGCRWTTSRSSTLSSAAGPRRSRGRIHDQGARGHRREAYAKALRPRRQPAQRAAVPHREARRDARNHCPEAARQPHRPGGSELPEGQFTCAAPGAAGDSSHAVGRALARASRPADVEKTAETIVADVLENTAAVADGREPRRCEDLSRPRRAIRSTPSPGATGTTVNQLKIWNKLQTTT